MERTWKSLARNAADKQSKKISHMKEKCHIGSLQKYQKIKHKNGVLV